MSQLKPSTHGIVVDHKESNVRFAISDANYNPDVHRKVRDLRPGETVRGYQPRRKGSLQENGDQGSGAGSQDAAGDQAVVSGDSGTDKTEGSAPAGTKGK